MMSADPESESGWRPASPISERAAGVLPGASAAPAAAFADVAAATGAAGNMTHAAVDAGLALRASLEAALATGSDRLLLAVSGGSDSMALLFAAARWARGRVAAVATYDHGTGAYASEASSLVVAEARRLGLAVVRENARRRVRGEAAWRELRWEFLRRVAAGFGAQVVTAHTRDDHLETIVIRMMRGTGARGLAALAAPSSVLRPWLNLSRTELRQWLEATGRPFLDDPMNISRAYQRVRVRLDLLPALEQASPGFGRDMIAIAGRAAALRLELDSLLERSGLEVTKGGREVEVPASVVECTTAEGRALLWPAICAKAGVTLDTAGIRTLVAFTGAQRVGASATPAGGRVTRLRRRQVDGKKVDVFVVETRDAADPTGVKSPDMVIEPEAGRQPTDQTPWRWRGRWSELPARLGKWRFRKLDTQEPTNLWAMGLEAGTMVDLRPWQAGDCLNTNGFPTGRRVTRYFSEFGVRVPDRRLWPVLVEGDEVVWVPGLGRSEAAPFRSGRPELLWYLCEREPD